VGILTERETEGEHQLAHGGGGIGGLARGTHEP
jgi:hypothetical protein